VAAAPLAGKVALVTGAGRGIGRAIAEKLAAEGARLVVNDLDPVELSETVADVASHGGEAVGCAGDVTQPSFGDTFVGTAIDAFGSVDIIVNNAGYTWDAVLQKMTDEQWQAMLDVHVTAPFRILRAAAPWLREQARRDQAEGREVFRKVVNISSASGLGGNPGQANYAAAKSGINGLTKTLAKEWGRYRVNVNSVAFGLIRTRLTEAPANVDGSIQLDDKRIKVGVTAEQLASFERSIPLGRGATPDEAAGAVYLLCTPESDYITGHILLCTGGIPM